MAGYHGRRAPNVAQYLRELNTIQPATPATTADDGFGNSLDDDLMMFTNTQFFDFETGQNTDYQSHPPKPDVVETPSSKGDDTHPPSAASTTTMDEFSSLDFMSGEFNFPDFGGPYTSPTMQTYPESLSIQPGAQSIYPMPPQAQQQRALGTQNGFAAPQTPRLAADTRKTRAVPEPTLVAAPSRPLNLEDASRMAAEEDKRRRNTAASARFRIKKKEREKALEKSAKEMNDKVLTLENRISQLETENKWLKNIIMEKNEGNEDIAKLWKEFSSKQLAEGSKKPVKKAVRTTSPEEHEGGDFTG